MKVNRIHHVAYRCIDAKKTVDWYVKHLNMDFVLAIAEDLVPSTKAPDPYMHVFLDAGHGNVLAFFELPTAPAMGRDTNTPDWVQHIARGRQSTFTSQRHRRDWRDRSHHLQIHLFLRPKRPSLRTSMRHRYNRNARKTRCSEMGHARGVEPNPSRTQTCRVDA
jgi:catechol 2,3-dioxygenase-like lactoylglutathione lyase family enzyme